MAYIHFTVLGVSLAPTFAKDGFIKYNPKDAERVKSSILSKRDIPQCSLASGWVGSHLARIEMWRNNN
jgi:hypothetical protein